MAELYFEGDITIAFEAGRKAGELAAAGGYLDVHCHDAALECLGQVNALTRRHHEPVPVGASEGTPEGVGAQMVELCERGDGMMAGASAADADLPPETVALLVQLAALAIKLVEWWRNR